MSSNHSPALDGGVKRFRRWLANKLASLARRIYPQSEEAMSFYMDRMMEMVLTGQSTVKVTAVPYEEMSEQEKKSATDKAP